MRLIDADALTKRLIEFCNKNCPYTAKARDIMCGSCFMGLALETVEDAPTIEPERKWETCFDCPLSNGCPKIRGCTNEQAEGYASDIPDDCPLSIEPERKSGHWIIYTVSMLDGEDCKCSECGQTSCAPYWNFCPNCGAKMEEGEQDEVDRR